MTISTDNQEKLLSWAKQVIGFGFREGAKAIARIEGDNIRAVVVYDNFTSCDCSMHIASDQTAHWMTRELMLEAFRYPFITCNLRRVTGLVPGKNKKALRFDQKLGFKYEGTMRNALIDDDIVFLGMLRSECRLIPKEHRND
jgi:RimJ/RimL family protein N-acetyltransferase